MKVTDKYLNTDKYDVFVNIIIPVFNSPEWTKRCINNVLKNTDYPFRIIIIDDCSDQYMHNCLKEYENTYEDIELIVNKENIGFVKSCNKGMSISGSQFDVILNTDALVPPGWLSRLVKCAESDSNIGIVNPLSNGAANISIPIAPGCNYIGQDEGLNNFLPKYPDIVTAVGFCLLLRKSMLDEIGLFDEIYGRGYCEETDLCLRAMQSNWRVVACDNLYIYHRGETSFSDRSSRYENNMKIFLNRYGEQYELAFKEFIKKAPLTRISTLVSEPPKSSAKEWSILLGIIARDLLGLHPFRALRHCKEGKSSKLIQHDVKRYLQFSRSKVKSITFLFDSLGLFGGTISVLHLVNGLIELGYEVKIAALYGGDGHLKGCLTQPLFFGNEKNLLKNIPESDMYVSTLWTTAFWLPVLKNRFQDAKYVSYLQDYEIQFLPESSNDREKVVNSYECPEYIISTSHWLSNNLKRHNKNSTIIPKGVDTDIFRRKTNNKRICNSILAMVRPKSTYRGFGKIKIIYERLKMIDPEIELGVFGVDNKSLKSFKIPVINHGIIENGPELADLYNRYSIFIDPSDFQGFGMMGLEAMACGCACVMTNVGGILDYAINDYNCKLNDPDDIAGFVKSINNILGDTGLKKKIITNGFETANNFSLEREINSMKLLFDNLLLEDDIENTN